MSRTVSAYFNIGAASVNAAVFVWLDQPINLAAAVFCGLFAIVNAVSE